MTPHDWAQLSEWIDGGLSGEAKTEFEARLQREPELAEAARRLKSLADTARTLAPTPADAEAWKKTVPRSLPLGPILGVLLLVAAGAGLVAGQTTAPNEGAPTTSLPPEAAAAPTFDSGVATLAPPPEEAPPPQPVVSPDSGVADAGAVAPGAPPMPLRPDASTPLVVAALLATAAQAGPPPTVHVNPGEPWLIHSPSSEVTVSPEGVAAVRPLGENVTRVSADQPVKLQVTSSPRDGGTPTVVVLDISAQRDLEFTIPLDVGSSRHIWAPGRVRFAVGSSATARVTEDGDRLRVEGVQPGETSVEAWFSDGAHLAWPVRVTARSESDVIELRVGQQKVVTFQAGQRASLEDPSLARVQPIGNRQVLLIAMRPGRSTLLITGDDAGVRRRPIVVTGAAIDEEPASVEAVTLSDSPREQGPWRVRQNHAIRFSSPAGLSRVRSKPDLVLASMKDGAVLVRGTAPGRAVIEIVFHDGAEVKLTVVVDP